jgi:hypothetical protein
LSLEFSEEAWTEPLVVYAGWWFVGKIFVGARDIISLSCGDVDIENSGSCYRIAYNTAVKRGEVETAIRLLCSLGRSRLLGEVRTFGALSPSVYILIARTTSVARGCGRKLWQLSRAILDSDDVAWRHSQRSSRVIHNF